VVAARQWNIALLILKDSLAVVVGYFEEVSLVRQSRFSIQLYRLVTQTAHLPAKHHMQLSKAAY